MAEYKVIYSPKLWQRLNDLLSYLSTNWGIKVADDFLFVFEQKMNLLMKNPKIGRLSSKRRGIRSISITKHNRVYYQVKKDTIIIATLFDTRQHPSKNKFE